MTAVRLMAAAVVVGLLAVSARADEKKTDTAKQLVGVWEITKTHENGPPPGTTIEFTKDGKLKLAMKMGDQDVKVEGSYKVEGKGFTFTIKMGDQEHSDTITIKKISKTEMTCENKQGETVELKKK